MLSVRQCTGQKKHNSCTENETNKIGTCVRMVKTLRNVETEAHILAQISNVSRARAWTCTMLIKFDFIETPTEITVAVGNVKCATTKSNSLVGSLWQQTVIRWPSELCNISATTQRLPCDIYLQKR